MVHQLHYWVYTPKSWKQGLKRVMYTPMFKAALFLTAKRWKHLRCSATGEWINKMCCTDTMQYYSTLKRHEWGFKTLCSVKQPDTKEQTLYGFTYLRYLEYSNSWQLPEERKGSNGSYYLTGTELQLEKMKSSEDRRWWWLHDIVNTLKAVELYT